MPEPIRSSSSESNLDNCDLMCIDPERAGAGNVPAPRSSPTGAHGVPSGAPDTPPQTPASAAAVSTLVRNQTPAFPTLEFARRQAEPPAPQNNAERVANTQMSVLLADRGETPDGVEFARAAFMYGHDRDSGFVDEVASVSIQRGPQREVQVTGVRLGQISDDGLDSLVAEAATAELSYGTHNKDGSTGFNASAGVTLAGIEGTLNRHGSSITLGASIGTSFGLSVGKRDSDADNIPEFCGRLSLPAFTIGACIEPD